MTEIAIREKPNLLKNCPPQYKSEAKQFFSWIDGKYNPLDPEGWRGYLASLSEVQPAGSGRMEGLSYSSASIAKRINVITERCRYLMVDRPPHEKARVESELGKLTRPQKEKKKPKYLKPEEVRKLIDETEEKLSLIIRFMFLTGLRVSECSHLVHKAVKCDNGNLSIGFRGKGRGGGKPATIRFSKPIYEEIKRVFRGRIYLFETPRGKPYHRSDLSMQIKRAGKRILETDISAHTLRHSAAMHVYDKTKNILETSLFMRHSNPQVTIAMYLQAEWDWHKQESVMSDFDISEENVTDE